jgi:hypothetical protein
MVVGSDAGMTHQSGLFSEWNETDWSLLPAPTPSTDPDDQNSSVENVLDGVSCPSTTFCVTWQHPASGWLRPHRRRGLLGGGSRRRDLQRRRRRIRRVGGRCEPGHPLCGDRHLTSGRLTTLGSHTGQAPPGWGVSAGFSPFQQVGLRRSTWPGEYLPSMCLLASVVHA